MKPMARRTGIGSSRTSWPATWTLPALAVSSVASTRSVVVLPAPLGPKMLRKPPRSRLKEMPFSTSRRPNVLRRPSTSISRGAALSCRSGESDMGHPPLGRGAVRAGGVAYGGVRFRDPRLLLLPAPARPQRDHSAGALVHRPVGKGVAVQAGGRAGLDLDDGRLLDLVDVGTEQAGDDEHHA